MKNKSGNKLYSKYGLVARKNTDEANVLVVLKARTMDKAIKEAAYIISDMKPSAREQYSSFNIGNFQFKKAEGRVGWLLEDTGSSNIVEHFILSEDVLQEAIKAPKFEDQKSYYMLEICAEEALAKFKDDLLKGNWKKLPAEQRSALSNELKIKEKFCKMVIKASKTKYLSPEDAHTVSLCGNILDELYSSYVRLPLHDRRFSDVGFEMDLNFAMADTFARLCGR